MKDSFLALTVLSIYFIPIYHLLSLAINPVCPQSFVIPRSPALYSLEFCNPRLKHPILPQPIITTPTCNHPSAYDAPWITNSSNSAPIGTTAPCRTGLARIGVRRLGNRAGSKACSAAPSVCEGVIGDWTTRRVCVGVCGEDEEEEAVMVVLVVGIGEWDATDGGEGR